jgi:hypothetical protein
MAMQVESLEILEKAEVAPAQARAIVRAIEVEIAGARDTLATKQDLLVLKQDVRALGQDLRQEMAQSTAKLRTEMAEQGGRLKGEMHAIGSSITRQMYLAILGQMSVLFGFAYFFATHMR